MATRTCFAETDDKSRLNSNYPIPKLPDSKFGEERDDTVVRNELEIDVRDGSYVTHCVVLVYTVQSSCPVQTQCVCLYLPVI